MSNFGLFAFFRRLARRKKVFVAAIFLALTFLAVQLLLWRSHDSASSAANTRLVIRRWMHPEEEEEFDCSEYTISARTDALRVVLDNVRAELAESSAKLQQVTSRLEDTVRTLSTKESQLRDVEEQIETARRDLLDVQDQSKLRTLVRMPLAPAKTMKTGSFLPPPPPSSSSSYDSVASPDNFFDFSRCPVSNLDAKIHLTDLPKDASTRALLVYESFRAVAKLSRSRQQDSCLTVTITDSGNSTGFQQIDQDGRNHIIVDVSTTAPKVFPKFATIIASYTRPGRWRSQWDEVLCLDNTVPSVKSDDFWRSLASLLPYSRSNLFVVPYSVGIPMEALDQLEVVAKDAGDAIVVFRNASISSVPEHHHANMRDSHFTILSPSDPNFPCAFRSALMAGSIPVVLSLDVPLPFQDLIDWRRAALRIPRARLPELNLILRAITSADQLELRRQGRRLLETYLIDLRSLVSSLFATMRHRLFLPGGSDRPSITEVSAFGLNRSWEAPIGMPVNTPPFDDEYLGPLERALASPSYAHNYTRLGMYAYTLWNDWMSALDGGADEFFLGDSEPPVDAHLDPIAGIGMRPIASGSGVEFSHAQGGNRAREHFTVVLLAYRRDDVLAAALERLHRIPYLAKVIVVWNDSPNRTPRPNWPRLNVPVVWVGVERNSLNNRFVPWAAIETEAVLSLDDDVDLKAAEIELAFRVWREERTRIVGFPARHHARYDAALSGDLYYNSNHTCQLSLVLTGAAFIHKHYLEVYTHQMPADIRTYVDERMNCEDLAMNMLVAHITRKPPLKVTSKWTIRCPTCPETLSQDESHFAERHDCLRFFSQVYGYNPLKHSQFRADSVLFKTHVPPNHQKCFHFV